MALTAGVLTKVSSSKTTASLSATAASGGTGPYTQNWYRSTVSGFTPGPSNIITGATALTLADSGLTPGTQYYYAVIYTDTGAGSATINSAQLAVATSAADQVQNQFAQSAILGMVDMKLNVETIAVQIDSSEAGSLVAGQAVKIVDSAGGVPKVIATSADADEVFGFLNYSGKDRVFVAGSAAEISQAGNVIQLNATGPIARGARVTLDSTMVGGVAQLVGSSGDRIVGYALDKATVGGVLIRVKLLCPSFAVA